MKQLTTLIKDYIGYYRKAKTIYNCHGPSIYTFANNVVESKNNSSQSVEIERIRKQLKSNNRKIDFVELGAGSTQTNSTTKTVAQITKSSLSRTTQCEQLYRIIKNYNCKNILEMGTSLGVSTMYIASANPKQIITLEGDPTVAGIAQHNFEQLSLKNIHIAIGDFKGTLKPALERLKHIDVAFVDGNHRYEPTVAYFHKILPYTTEQSILVFDDIYWSKEMKEAWNYIKHHERTQLSVDLFHMGIIFLEKTGKPEHYTLIPWRNKPWNIGIWG